jgi:hypothetical protein
MESCKSRTKRAGSSRITPPTSVTRDGEPCAPHPMEGRSSSSSSCFPSATSATRIPSERCWPSALPPSVFGLPAHAGLWRACIPVREGTSLRCAQRHRGDCLGGGGIDAASRRQAQGAGGPLPLVGPAPTVDVLPNSGSGGQVTRSGCQLVPGCPSRSAFESEQVNYNLIGSCKFVPTRF